MSSPQIERFFSCAGLRLAGWAVLGIKHFPPSLPEGMLWKEICLLPLAPGSCACEAWQGMEKLVLYRRGEQCDEHSTLTHKTGHFTTPHS